ncbi:Rot1 protein [Starmerella bacillaris]|uniref:Protein ROT1 n=1 Tax=Starmerella bacillaris TaxID=1247836 RepID=A0AAV5RP92_STABA|nr:Rot1 protein [Starmerella bacillaris]
MAQLLALAVAILAKYGADAQVALGGGAGGGPVGNTVYTTTYINGPTVAPPPIIEGPWTDVDHLEGTWCSKSMTVVTGPDFYDPIDELLIEPALPGISVSFTSDGYFEYASYQVASNPRDPKCATGAITFQHGTYNISDNKLHMTPFEDDGRQLVSDPCKSNKSSYVQYEQQLTFSKFQVWIDGYYGRYRLDLYQWDGTPLQPLYLVYRPPQMLPTITMNPGTKEQVNNHTNARRALNSNVRERIKRSLINRGKTKATLRKERSGLYNAVWYGGLAMISFGAGGWLYFS